MVINLGIIGLSEGNGHPFSFAAIVNGYSDTHLKQAGWDVIYNYVKIRDASEFGFEGVKITHAWTQDEETTKKLCAACLIPNAVANFEDMIGEVDGVIIARDDYEIHSKIAIPFLESGMYVFVDKPLTLSTDELEFFKPFLENGKLMSCSGMRYAKELDEIRQLFKEDNTFELIRGTVVNNWEKYGIHLLDAIFSFIDLKPASIRVIETTHESLLITLENGKLIQVDCVGSAAKIFRIDIVKNYRVYTVDIEDNFSMFRRTIWHFINMIKTDKAQINPEFTQKIIHLLIAGQVSIKQNKEVLFNDSKNCN